MLFHVTIGHDARDCPGRRPMEPPELIAPSDSREALGIQFGVKLHFVLWGAACMLWAQPEHLAFAVLEAEDVESALQYIGQLVPESWTCQLLPVWNLPSQLRLIRQVQRAPTMLLGDVLPQGEPNSRPTEEPQMTPASSSPERAEDAPADVIASGDYETWPQTGSDANSPGTITRLLEDLEKTPAGEGERSETGVAAEGAQPAQDQAGEWATQIEQFNAPPAPEALQAPRVRAWLVTTAGPNKGRTFPIPLDGATIGRLPENTIYIPDERLSREHARIEFRDGTFFLNDLGSRNGTALNGSLVSNPQPLHGGDTIELGSNTLIVGIEAGRSATEE